MNKFLVVLVFYSSLALSADTVEMDPNEIQFSPTMHESLSPDLLKRIQALADTFEIVDGVSYAQSVDLYKRDLDPEANIVIYEEMARVYNQFCKNRCSTQAERMDVYRLVLLRSMFPGNEALKRVKLSVVSESEAMQILANYKLKAEPIAVIQQ